MLAEATGDRGMHAIFTEQLIASRRAALQVAIDTIAGPMIYRVLPGGLDFSEPAERAQCILTTVMDGLRPR